MVRWLDWRHLEANILILKYFVLLLRNSCLLSVVCVLLNFLVTNFLSLFFAAHQLSVVSCQTVHY